MLRPKLSLTLLILACILPQADATIEFIYAIKEKVHQQQGNTQATAPTEWSYGAGASGDSGLTAVSVTLPGAGSATVIVGEEGSFDLDPENVASQAEMDAAFPNGSLSLSVTDGGTDQDLGPFTISGDGYPNTPHITNALELQASDYSQDFILTWNTFAGSDADDQVLLQIWDDDANEELIFEFLDRTATSYTIPGGTFSNDNYYDVDVIFINETDGLSSPETIIGYLSTTSYLLSTHTSDTELSLYKWQRSQQTASDLVQVDRYQALVTVSGDSQTVSYAEINSPSANYVLNSIGGNTQLLFTEFNSKAELDIAYPAGEYLFWVSEDDVFTNYGEYLLPGDAYPTSPQFQNFTEILNFDAMEEQSISWVAAPGNVSFVQVRILDGLDNVWTQGFDSSVTSTVLPANTLNQDKEYSLVLRFWAPAITNENPPTELGYLSSTYMDFQTSSDGGGDPGIEFAYIIKERSFSQDSNAAPTDPLGWSFGAGVEGGNDVIGNSLDYPGGSLPLVGSPGEYEIEDADFPTQAALDAAFPSGAYTLNLSVDAVEQALGPFDISGDAYPAAPQILNLEEFRAHDFTQNFTLNWSPFSDADPNDQILIQIESRTDNQEVAFEFLDASTTSYEIPGGSILPEKRYRIELLFINETDGVESPETIIGYLSCTDADISTFTSDTELSFFKLQLSRQVSSETLEVQGYRPLGLVVGQSNSITYAEINSPGASTPLIQFAPNSYILSTPLDTKDALDASYPPGHYLFYVEENQEFVLYDDYQLPIDSYPDAPRLQNFDDLVSFDSSLEQFIQWDAPSAGVTFVRAQIRDESSQIVWSDDIDPSVTSILLPPDTLDPFSDYDLYLRFGETKDGSDFPDVAIGYLSVTHLPLQTFTSATDYATWQAQFFTEQEILDPSIAGPEADADGDRLTNQFEFLAKLNPVDSTSSLAFEFTNDPDEKLTIGPLNNDVNWVLQVSQNLQGWTTVPSDGYEILGTEIQLDLDSFLPNTFFQIGLSTAIP